ALWGIKEIFWLAVAAAIVLGGLYGYRYLGENREVAEAVEIARPVARVDTMALTAFDGPLPIRGEGFVRPFRELSLSPQVSGKVTDIHPAIINRGRFQAGDVLVYLDARVQVTALDQTEANIAATRARLDQLRTELERSQALLQRQVTTQTQVDALISQRDELEANLRGLTAAREAAQIALSDRQIIAPFDGAVLSRSVEIGDVVSPGQALARVFTETEMEVDVAVRQADAALIPGLFADTRAQARVSIPFADYTFNWVGSVARVEPQLDAVTRTLAVTVRLDALADVTGRTATGETIASGAPPALINAFAKVTIDGLVPRLAYQIPSTAVRNGDTLWLAEGGQLRMVPVSVLHVDGDATWVVADPDQSLTGQRVITSPLPAPFDGMPLRDLHANPQTAELTGDRS
ncbi:MAG: efflux RND transporter periplasmic adaptor subunit, partial [Paracoccaceae bacterium]